MDAKLRVRKPSTSFIKPTTTSHLPVVLDEEVKSRKRPFHRRTMRNAALKIWLGGSILLVVLGRQYSQTEAAGDHVQEAIVSAKEAIVQALDENKDPEASSHHGGRRQPLYGNLTSALYRFPASKLGPEYLAAVAKFDEFIGRTVDPVGASFAARRTREPGPKQFHQECYLPPEEEKLVELEQKKKMHKYKDIPRLEFLQSEQEMFFGAAAETDGETTMITQDRKWAWRTAASFSAQFAGRQHEFRQSVQSALNIPGHEDFFGGLVSGTFWYPPNAIREWHTNAWDMSIDSDTGKPEWPWRMYFVRQKAATPDGQLDASRTAQNEPTYFKDKSGMHLVDGPGLPPERLEEFGAYRLTQQKEDGTSVWRIPDQDGYVSLFRLQAEKPYRWHCIVSDDSVHRWSMGMSLSDEGVEAMLKYAGIEL